MAKITSISPTDRVGQRSAAEAEAELRFAITDINAALEVLAIQYPGVVVLAGIYADLVSPVAVDRSQSLARIVGHLPLELRAAFEAELAGVPYMEPTHELRFVVP